MSRLTVQTGADNQILREKSKPVEKVTKETLKLIRDMEETMDKENGIGLAAPQVGVHQRIILIAKLTEDEKEITGTMTLINPEILEYSVDSVVMEEGCLSLPDKFAKVRRPKGVKVRFEDVKGRTHTMHFEKLPARIIQHEIDHLEGILFTDNIEGELEDVAKRTSDEFLV